MQRSGTKAIRTQIQPSKPRREITRITNSQNTKRTYGQSSEHLFPSNQIDPCSRAVTIYKVILCIWHSKNLNET